MISSTERPGKRARYSALNSSISAAAIFLNAGSIASPDSIWAESMRRVLGRSDQSPPSTLLKIGRTPGTGTVEPSGSVLSQPEIQSKTSLLMLVFWQTTMNTGGVPEPAAFQAR